MPDAEVGLPADPQPQEPSESLRQIRLDRASVSSEVYIISFYFCKWMATPPAVNRLAVCDRLIALAFAGECRRTANLSTGVFWLDTSVGGAIHRWATARSPPDVHNLGCTRQKLYKPIESGAAASRKRGGA
jgi:hypothetical protein